MTKVLVWNLENFGINKINDPRTQRAPNTGGNTYQYASYMRRIVVNRTLLFTDPDIIVLVEVSSGDNRLSDLGTQTGGMQGCVYLLNYLRTNALYSAGNWRLVPPLRVGLGGKAEAVAIFYRGRSVVNGANVNRYFTGPNVWTGGYDGYSVLPGGGVPNAYPSNGTIDFNRMVVPAGSQARDIPGGALHNGGLKENRVAARNRFTDFDFSTLREPYLATFTETDNAGTVTRNLSVVGIHAPAVTGDQMTFMNALAVLPEVSDNLGNLETRLVAGDFNLNLLNNQGNYSGVYVPLTTNQYTLLLTPAGGPPVNLDQYTGYFATHVKGTDLTSGSRFLWSQNNNNQSYYPGFGYTGSERVTNFYSIDNMLVRPFNNNNNYRTTIMNHVVGTPFNAVANPAGNPPTGAVFMPNSFAFLPWPPAPTAPNWTVGSARQRTGWINYGHIYRTSDHFATFADV
jgi:hypothetical protein